MRKYACRPYTVTPYQKAALEFLRPPEDMTVSQWADSHRIMDELSSNMPGPWHTETTPYLRGIMDEFNNYETERIIFVKPTQVGGTESIQNMIGYVVDQDPGPAMIVYPTDKLGEWTSENRLQPMMKASDTLAEKYNDRRSETLELKFDNMYLAIAGANSPSSLASRPIRYLFLDEVDKYPSASKKEADAMSLAIERTKTFTGNRKIVLASTPTLTTGNIWKAKEAADVEKHYFVPCPHCGKFIELVFSQLKWPGKEEGMDHADRAELASYVCQECDCIITDRDKAIMLKRGQWRIVRGKEGVARSVAFWLNTLYSPFTRFSEIAKAFMDSKDDQDLYHNFTNSWLAEPWEATKLKTSAELVKERQTEMQPYIVPDWARLITGGVDVQENCLYWTIRAWGAYLTSQNIAHGQAISLADISNTMNMEFHKEDGTTMMVDLCLIDSGDQTVDIYEYCAMNADWAVPCKGSSTNMQSHFKISQVNKTESAAHGMRLIIIDTAKYKDMIAARMKKPNGRGSWMVHADIDDDYCNQVTAEHKVAEGTGVKQRLIWKKKLTKADNHYLDAEVYNACAADLMGVRQLFLTEGKAQEPAPPQPHKPQEQPAAVPEDNWIKANDGWIGQEG